MRIDETLGTLNRMHVGRWVAMLGGGTLISYGVARRSRLSWMLVPLGAGMVYRAARANRHIGEDQAVSVPFGEGVCIEESVIIDKSPEELYTFWRNLENLRFIKQLEAVYVLDDLHSHWIVRAPAGQKIQWDAEIINEIPNRLIGWRSLANADVPNAGSVHFDPAPDGRGTIVQVEIEYQPPIARVGDAVAKLLGQDAGQLVRENLKRFKALMETGEMATIPGQPQGSRDGLSNLA